jgi:hypothetical protein
MSANLDSQRRLVVLVKEVPDVERPVHLCGEEDPGASWRPGAAREVGRVVLCRQDRGADRRVIGPYTGSPVAWIGGAG